MKPLILLLASLALATPSLAEVQIEIGPIEIQFTTADQQPIEGIIHRYTLMIEEREYSLFSFLLASRPECTLNYCWVGKTLKKEFFTSSEDGKVEIPKLSYHFPTPRVRFGIFNQNTIARDIPFEHKGENYLCRTLTNPDNLNSEYALKFSKPRCDQYIEYSNRDLVEVIEKESKIQCQYSFTNDELIEYTDGMIEKCRAYLDDHPELLNNRLVFKTNH